MTDGPSLDLTMDTKPPMRVPPLSQRGKWGPPPPRVAPALRRRIVFRARIAVDYPTTLDPSDLPYWFAGALIGDAERVGVDIDLLQIALAADPAWRAAGPADLLEDTDRPIQARP
jgi:hypothetical protein